MGRSRDSGFERRWLRPPLPRSLSPILLRLGPLCYASQCYLHTALQCLCPTLGPLRYGSTPSQCYLPTSLQRYCPTHVTFSVRSSCAFAIASSYAYAGVSCYTSAVLSCYASAGPRWELTAAAHHVWARRRRRRRRSGSPPPRRKSDGCALTAHCLLSAHCCGSGERSLLSERSLFWGPRQCSCP
eukprot:1405451-Rhodomonas_salina.1